MNTIRYTRYHCLVPHDVPNPNTNQVKEHLKRFQNLPATSPEYVPRLQALYADLAQHIAEEEEFDLPVLEKALVQNSARGKELSESLAKTFERTKYFVPSRSHPAAGENPIFESVVGLLTTPIDKLGDMLRKFPEEDTRKFPDGDARKFLDREVNKSADGQVRP